MDHEWFRTGQTGSDPFGTAKNATLSSKKKRMSEISRTRSCFAWFRIVRAVAFTSVQVCFVCAGAYSSVQVCFMCVQVCSAMFRCVSCEFWCVKQCSGVFHVCPSVLTSVMVPHLAKTGPAPERSFPSFLQSTCWLSALNVCLEHFPLLSRHLSFRFRYLLLPSILFGSLLFIASRYNDWRSQHAT